MANSTFSKLILLSLACIPKPDLVTAGSVPNAFARNHADRLRAEHSFCAYAQSFAPWEASLASSSLVVAPLPVRGRVTGPNKEPILGATVVVKGSTVGTATDADGNFSLTLPDGNATLVISSIGFANQEVAVNGRTDISITLQNDTKALDEVVVVGYGTQRRQDVTGAIATVKAEDIRTQGTNTVQKSLQGRVAGVQIESSGGNPGSGVRVIVRGAGSLNNNDPLYIVDGVQVDNINNLQPTDIASFDVLKDASAAAIYGSRAANGVVLITTKGGKKGENRIDFNAYYGVQQIAKKIDVLNASEWATVSNTAHDAAGLPRLDIAKNPESLGAGTDWQKEIYQTAPMQNYTLGASGGSENFTYNLSGGYLDQQGIVKKTDYDRYNLRLKTDFTKGRVRIGETIILTREYWRTMAGGWGGQGGNPVGSALKMIPVFQVYDPTAVGGYGGAYGQVVNIASPVAQLNLEVPETRTTSAILNGYAEVSLVDALKYRLNLGYTNTFGAHNDYTFPYKVGALFNNADADLYQSKSQKEYFLQEHTLSYNKELGKHNFNGLVGFTYQNTRFDVQSGSKSGMPAGIQVLDAGTANIASGGYAYESALVSYLGRLVYSYDNRYVLTGTFRRDGSSRFSPDYRYGNFPAVALAWNVVNESFFQPLQGVVSNLKLRSSYGVLGNQEFDNYQFDPTITSNANYVIGQTQLLWPGAIQTAFATPNIKWETSKTFNIGTDLGFFENKLGVSADYFIRRNSDILLRVPIPLTTGASANAPYINAGQITNKGVEAALSYNNKVGEFTYQVTGTFTAIDNNVDFLGTGTQQISGGQPTHHGQSATITKAGGPVGAFYLIKTAGIFNSQEEIDAHSVEGRLIQPAAKPGDIRFVDYNGDGTISQDDRQYCGSPNPKFSYGFGSNSSWKNFDFSFFFQGTYGNKIYNGLREDLEGMNLEFNYSPATLNAWTPDNPTDFPRAVINDPNLNSRTSNRFLESGSYLRLRTLQLGYTLPKGVLSVAKINSCRFYVSFDNLFTITNYSGFSPDLGRYNGTDRDGRQVAGGGILDRGVDFPHVAYPLSRTSLLGVQLSF
ncbi:TonB-dependent receptor [Hymenobacter sp. YC55]|uniref:SusC/RagA family TonB-linked outer membrane protein n=1 Tax=Hymenobacter sp. YC55 TaxID=3034019 RepID=UPI0023F86CB1|nr:TonB-dependent receptor [Hymenobacter sp. YC55]MDF7812695.1 TonB-dependent receptor [Hymenobacter sp. YC55]